MSYEGDVGSGITTHFVDSVTTVATPIPTTANRSIKSYFIKCAVDQDAALRLKYSLDGTNYSVLRPGEAEYGDLLTPTTQIYIKSAASTVAYEIILNRI